MGTEVLWPQDLLADRSSFHRRKNFPANGNLTKLVVNRRTHSNNGRKTSPRVDNKRLNDNDCPKRPDPRRKDDGAGAGQVTLLRRGESLDSLISKKKGNGPNGNPKIKPPQPVDDLAVLATARIGPESPEMMPNKILASPPPPPPLNVYAGSAFSLSPSPKSLPLPSFFNKKRQNSDVTDSATRDLRRLLRLD